MIVEYVSDTSKLMAGVQDAAKSQKIMQDTTLSATNSMSAGYKSSASDIQAFTVKAESAGQNVAKLTTLQLNAGAASARLGVAQATAAEAIKKASDMASGGAASAEHIAVAQARATLATERVAVAQNAEAVAMGKVQAEAARLQVSMDAVAVSEDTVAASSMTAKEAATGIGTAFFAVAAVAAVIGVATVNMAGNFESGITSLKTGAGELQSNLQMVSSGILDMAVPVGTTTAQLEAGMYLVESSGQHGAKALQTLKDAAMGAKVGSADLGDTANGVTTIMTDYASANISSAQAVNTLIATVSAGKTHMGELATAMSTILPTSSAVGVSLTDTSAAMATMTAEGTPAAEAATFLRQTLLALNAPSAQAKSALEDVGLTTADVSAAMKKSLPDALQMITDAIGKKFPIGSAAYIDAMKNIVGGTDQLQGLLALTGTHLQTFKDNVSNITDAVNKGGSSITGWVDVQKDFNFKLSQAREVVETLGIKIGTALLPYVGMLLDGFQHLVTIGGTVVSFFQNNQAAMIALQAVLIPVAGAIGGALVFALVAAAVAAWSAAAGMIALTWPFLLIGAGVAALVVGIVLLVQHWNQVSQAFQNNAVFQVVWRILQQFGAFLVSVFVPVWQQLVAVWQSQLLPAFQQVWAAIQNLWISLQPLVPVLQVIGAVIAGVVIVQLAIFMAMIGGLAKGIAGMLPGLAQAFGGIVQIISGMITVITGIISLFIDLFTGKWGKLGADLAQIWRGIVSMFQGEWNLIAGIFNAAIGLVVGYISGFVSTIIGFFTSLYHSLVGGSVIPDLVNGIVSWFGQLPGRVGAIILQLISQGVANFVNFNVQIVNLAIALVNGFIGQLSQIISRVAGVLNSMVSTALGIINGLASSALSAGASIVNNIAAGIRGAIGSVAGAITSVTDFIAAHLPHSPAKLGALRDLNYQGTQIVGQVSEGMVAGLPQLETAIGQVTKPVALALGTSGTRVQPSSSSSASANSKQQTTTPIHQDVYIIIDGQKFAKATIVHLGPEFAKEVRAVLK